MRTKFGPQVTLVAKDPEDPRFLLAKRIDGSHIWGIISDFLPQDQADVDILANIAALPDRCDCEECRMRIGGWYAPSN